MEILNYYARPFMGESWIEYRDDAGIGKLTYGETVIEGEAAVEEEKAHGLRVNWADCDLSFILWQLKRSGADPDLLAYLET